MIPTLQTLCAYICVRLNVPRSRHMRELFPILKYESIEDGIKDDAVDLFPPQYYRRTKSYRRHRLIPLIDLAAEHGAIHILRDFLKDIPGRPLMLRALGLHCRYAETLEALNYWGAIRDADDWKWLAQSNPHVEPLRWLIGKLRAWRPISRYVLNPRWDTPEKLQFVLEMLVAEGQEAEIIDIRVCMLKYKNQEHMRVFQQICPGHFEGLLQFCVGCSDGTMEWVMFLFNLGAKLTRRDISRAEPEMRPHLTELYNLQGHSWF